MDAIQAMAQKLARLERKIETIEARDNAGAWAYPSALQGSWVADSAYMSPRIIVHPAFVFADGVAKSGTVGDGSPIMYLPRGYYPPERWIVGTVDNGSLASVNAPNWGGYISARAGTGALFSFGGVRYPLVGWQPLTLVNSWAQYAGGTMPGYCIDRMGVLTLKGFIASGTTNANIASLSTGTSATRNAAHIYGVIANDAFARVDILADGSIKHITGSTTWFAINGVALPLGATWTAPTFAGTWANYGTVSSVTYASAGYWKDAAGFVWLDGVIKSGTINTTAFTLPEGYRPSKTLVRYVASNDAVGTVGITSAGAVVPTSGSSTYVSLCGIKFKAEL